MEYDMESWIYRLKDAYDACYYRTDAASQAQMSFPWQNKTCADCPFWNNSVCQVHVEYRNPDAHTCAFFDPWNREAARAMMTERQWGGFRQWWEWFNDRGATR